MRNILSKTWKLLLSTVFGVAVFIFWYYGYKAAIGYQEQFQLFLFSSDYLAERLSVPGGGADYVAEFLTQFYYIPLLGGIILALLLVAVQRLVWRLARYHGATDGIYPLSFIPSLLLWFVLGDENVLLCWVVAIVGVLLCLWLFHRIVSHSDSPFYLPLVFTALAVPLVYWLLGSVMLWMALYMGVLMMRQWRGFRGLALGVVCMAYALAVVLFSATWLPYPLYRLMGGINYYRYPAFISLLQVTAVVLTLLIPWILGYVGSRHRGRVAVAVQVVVLIILGAIFVPRGFDSTKYSLIEYDYMVRRHQWQDIIAKAECQQPSSPLDVSCVNFALAMTGQLSDRLFEFYQHGGEGLFPSFQRDMTSPISTGELFFQLGMINDAERYAFEAQQAIPNFRKSGRLTKRLAECNIINGQYGVARKYLDILRQSLAYDEWAESQIPLLGNEEAINKDPLYGRLRQLRQQKQDYLFSDTEMDQMMGLLFVQNFDNRMAYEYLMCYELLQGNLQKFYEYYPLGKYARFSYIPRAYQQALVAIWAQQNGNPEDMPWSIDPSVVRDFGGFMQSKGQDPRYAHTLWAYMHDHSQPTDKKEQHYREIY